LYDRSRRNLTAVNIVMPSRDRLSKLAVCFRPTQRESDAGAVQWSSLRLGLSPVRN
jgi:hypothetical protein